MGKAADFESIPISSNAGDSIDGDMLLNEKDGTVNDVQDMRRMGKKQQLRVKTGECSSE